MWRPTRPSSSRGDHRPAGRHEHLGAVGVRSARGNGRAAGTGGLTEDWMTPQYGPPTPEMPRIHDVPTVDLAGPSRSGTAADYGVPGTPVRPER